MPIDDDGKVEMPENPILVLKVGWSPDGDGMIFGTIIGEGNHPIKHVEPYMLEAVTTALHAIVVTKERMERLVLQEFLEKGRELRAQRKKLAELGLPPVPKKEELN